MLTGKLKLHNLAIVEGHVEADFELVAGVIDGPVDHPPVPQPLPGPAPKLPNYPSDFATNVNTGYQMLVASMNAHGLTPIGVQGHGRQIVDALNDSFPGLNVYLSPTDSPVWPGFGSLDVTINSGKGGWSFRPDGYFKYEPK